MNQNNNDKNVKSISFKIVLFFKNLFILKNVTKKNNLKLLILFDFYSYILGSVYKIFIDRKIKTILYINVPVQKYLSLKSFLSKNLLWLIFKNTLFSVDAIVFMSKGLRKNFKQTFSISTKIESKVLYQSVSQIRSINFNLHFNYNNNRKFTILSYGRFDRQKDFETIIKSYKMLDSYIIEKSRLLIVGEGSKKNDYNKLIGLDPNIIIKPWNTNIYKLLRKSQLFVFSSNFEGFGIAILESLNCGIPVLASDTQYGPNEILDNGKYGKLFSAHNVSVLKNLIALSFRDRRMLRKYAILGKARSRYFSPIKQKNELNNFIVKTLKLKES